MIFRVYWYVVARWYETRAEKAEEAARKYRERAEKFFHKLGLR